VTERSYEDAVQVLKRRIGGTWDGAEEDGRDEMVDILKDELGYDSRTANDAIDAMIQTGQIRYHHAAPAGGITDDPTLAPAAPVPTSPAAGSSSGLPAAPIAPGAAFGPGYWEIGREGQGVEVPPGRAGQVTPRT